MKKYIIRFLNESFTVMPSVENLIAKPVELDKGSEVKVYSSNINDNYASGIAALIKVNDDFFWVDAGYLMKQ